MGLLKEQCAEKKKGRLLYYCNLAWMQSGGLILWNAVAICEMFKALRRTIFGPVVPFGAMVEYHPIICKRPVKAPSIW